MKKVILTLIALVFTINSYAFWIWSPKTQKWKNPKYSALATPYLQFKEAEKLYQSGEYKRAYKEFRKVLVHYPDAQEAAEAQFYVAQCLEKMEKPYEAYQAFQQLIDSYPNSQRINEAVERVYGIGEYFLSREHKKLLGMSVYDFVDHPAIEIFQRLVDKAPYSEYAPRAQYKLGMILMELSRYDEARDAFQKTIDNYAQSEWAAPAKYQLALATAKAFPGADYDSTYLKEATKRLDEFIQEHPEAQISDEAEAQLGTLRNREAKKLFETAEFYERQNKNQSALIYYRKVINTYSGSDYYDLALQRAEELNTLVKQNLTRKEFQKQQKQEAAEEKRTEKARDKESKLQQKQDLKEAKMQESLERIEEAKAKKQAVRQESLSQKEQARQEQLNRKEQARQAKLEKIEAVKEKKEQARQEKLRQKEQARQAKLEKIEAAKAKKEAAKQEKLEKKEQARQAKLEKIEKAKARKEAARQAKLQKIEEAKAKKEAARQENLRRRGELNKTQEVVNQEESAGQTAEIESSENMPGTETIIPSGDSSGQSTVPFSDKPQAASNEIQAPPRLERELREEKTQGQIDKIYENLGKTGEGMNEGAQP